MASPDQHASTDEVAKYYDGYASRQERTGVNDRLYGLYQRSRKAGLHSGSNVLELGCGIGAMTGLLARTVRRGAIESVDLSPTSIATAQRRVPRTNISFHAADVITYAPALRSLDFVLLFDVLEHIPMERHAELFQRIAGYCDQQTKVLVHIPSPGHVEHDRVHSPQLLQVIDQSLPFHTLVADMAAAGLEVTRFEQYGIWNHGDYQYFELRLARPYAPVPVTTGRGFLFRLRTWLRRRWIRTAY